MSVIFEQGGAGAPFGTELATLTPQGASDTWHGACDKNARRSARAHQSRRAVCSKLKYIYHTYREEKNEF